MKTAISIPSYKHRYKNLLKYLNNSDIKDTFDVYVFLSNSDENIKEYDVYNNINLIKTNCNTLGDKKQYIFKYLYNKGYEKTFLIDDDIYAVGRKLQEGYMLKSGKGYKGVNIDFKELCEECDKKMNELNVSYLTTVKSFALGFYKPNKINIDKVNNLGQFGLFNIKRIIESGIRFTNEKYEHEDVDIVFQIKLHNLGIACLMYYTFFVDVKSIDNSSFVNNEVESLMHINLYLKYRDGITLRVDKNNKLRIIIRWGSYSDIDHIPIKNDKYHKELYELCKETILTKDIDKLKNFIKTK